LFVINRRIFFVVFHFKSNGVRWDPPVLIRLPSDTCTVFLPQKKVLLKISFRVTEELYCHQECLNVAALLFVTSVNVYHTTRRHVPEDGNETTTKTINPQILSVIRDL